MTTEVVKDEGSGRYELKVDGEVAGFAEFVTRGHDVELPHTVIDPARRGQGLGGVLIRAALEDIVGSEGKVIPTCSYVAAYILAHPEYADAVATA